jgi:hypothetical protein
VRALRCAAGTSKGAGGANGNDKEVNMSPETVELKLTVSKGDNVAVAFDIKVRRKGKKASRSGLPPARPWALPLPLPEHASCSAIAE